MGLMTTLTSLVQAIGADIKSLTNGKVNTAVGMGLSSNDYVTADKTKLAGIAAGAQVNAVTTVSGRTGAVVLTSTDVGLSNVNNTADASKPISTLQQAGLDAKVTGTLLTGAQFTPSSTSTTTDLLSPVSSVFTVAPAANSQGIFFGTFGQAVWTSPYSLTGGGHLCGAMGWGVLNNTGTLAMLIGTEGRVDHGQAGVTTSAKAVLGLLNCATGTMTEAAGVRSETNVTSPGVITLGHGFLAEVPSMTGTLTDYAAFRMNALPSTITTKKTVHGQDFNAPIITLSLIASSSYTFTSPVTGGSFTMAAGYDTLHLLHTATIAAFTIVFPDAALFPDGGIFKVFFRNAITTITASIPNAAGSFTSLTTAAANTTRAFQLLKNFNGGTTHYWSAVQ
jgi:hypothetical protein